MKRHIATALLLLACTLSTHAGQTATDSWAPVSGHIMTRWAEKVSPENAWREYPRPRMRRGENSWVNLNGLWDFGRTKSAEPPDPGVYRRKILVPFPVESALSGVKEAVDGTDFLFYHRRFVKPDDLAGRRLLLHFGAVDWHSAVWTNGKRIGEHKGGYDPFYFDITDALSVEREQEVVIRVSDPTDDYTQPRGKQMTRPYGIWYTPVSGIWQTVWLEVVPESHVQSLTITPNIDQREVILQVKGSQAAAGAEVVIEASAIRNGDTTEGVRLTANGRMDEAIKLSIPNPRLWSPDQPWLYDVTISLGQRGAIVDRVTSYFGMRKISLGHDAHGYARLLLNNKETFHWGLLDQGWWPDGLYAAPTDEALRYDIEVAKKLGFNLLRKHVKVEPERWYYHCDRLGILVWQDMPNGNLRQNKPDNLIVAPHQPDAKRDPESARQFEQELKAMIDARRSHPCIVAWVPFNEGWGQYDTIRITNWIRAYDPTRLIVPAAGWSDRGNGDISDNHMYPGPGMEPAEIRRAVVLGEFGGLGLPLDGHLWLNQSNWGYRTYNTSEELRARFRELHHHLRPIRSRGMAGAIYTQVSDVEIEVNGLMTYDRKVLKFDPAEMSELSRQLFAPYRLATWLVNDSETLPHAWLYSDEPPPTNWAQPDFDDSAWLSADAPFGNDANTLFPPGSLMKGDRIWLRKKFKLADRPGGASLKVTYGGKTKVYINGRIVAEYDWDRSRHYGDINISDRLDALRIGENVLAVETQRTHEREKRVDMGLYVY